MTKRKACKRCKLFVDGETCPNCKTSSFTTSWQGRLFISDQEGSMIAKQVGITAKGEYAIKIR